MGFLDRFRRKKKVEDETDFIEEKGLMEIENTDNFIEEIKLEEDQTELISIKPESEYKFLKVLHVYGLSDVSLIQKEIQQRNIIIADISPLMSGNGKVSVELKRSVEQLRGITRALDGDIAQLSDRYIIITPSGTKIWRRQPSEEGEP